MTPRPLWLIALLLAWGCDQPGGQRTRDSGAALVDAAPDWWFPDAGDQGSPDLVAPESDRCGGAVPLPWRGDRTSVAGTTDGARNEYADAIRCGEPTPLRGGQRYHALQLDSSQVYRLELRPSFAAVLILFADCGADVINTDCGSGGQTGQYLGPVAAGASGVSFFRPPATGTYLLAVDSLAAEERGSYELTLEAYPAPANGHCLEASALELVEGQLTVAGSTLGAKNEFGQQLRCGTGQDFDGPQVYYALELQAGSWYRLSLTPDFAASLLVANAAGGCLPQNLELDCAGITGSVLPLVRAGALGQTAFSPLQDGSYLLIVDSPGPESFGSFTLSAEVYQPPAGMTCSLAMPLTLEAGALTVSGDTSGLLNDRGAQLRCGTLPPPTGPQLYYTLALGQRTYELVLAASFEAIAAVGSSCATLPADCGSELSGTAVAAPAGGTGSRLFTPQAAGNYLIVVDGAGPEAQGTFSLSVREHQPPTNGSCQTPAELLLETSPAAVAGGTGPLQNDLSGVTCGSSDGPFSGPQAYYRLNLSGGVSYRLTLTPEASFDPALYAFAADTVCSTAALNAACAGQYADQLGQGVAEELILEPVTDQSYLVVVDSWSASEVGLFTLSVSW